MDTKLELLSDAMGLSMATLLDAMNDNDEAMDRVVAASRNQASDESVMLAKKLRDIK